MKKVIYLTIALCVSVVSTSNTFFDWQKLGNSKSAASIALRTALKYTRKLVPSPLGDKLMKVAKDGADQHLIFVLMEKLFDFGEKKQITSRKGIEDTTLFTTTYVAMHKVFNNTIQGVFDTFQKSDGTSIVSSKWQKQFRKSILGGLTAIACRLEREILSAVTTATAPAV